MNSKYLILFEPSLGTILKNSSNSPSVSSIAKLDSIAARNSCLDIVFVLKRSIFLNICSKLKKSF